MHARSAFMAAVKNALSGAGVKMVAATDAVQAEDVPCAVIEEREETNARFDKTQDHPATTLRRRIRFAVFAFGTTREERDDVAEQVEMAVTPALYGAGVVDATLVGVGFSRSVLGTSAAAFVAGQFYDAEYLSPTYM